MAEDESPRNSNQAWSSEADTEFTSEIKIAPRVPRKSAMAVATLQEQLLIPTVDENGYEKEWTEARQIAGMILHSKYFDLARGITLLFNILLLIWETDAESAEGEAPGWLHACNYLLLAMYTIELVARLATYRLHFFRSYGNLFDMGIILVDLFIEVVLSVASDSHGLPSVVLLRTFRLLRLGRIHKALHMFPELNIMILGVRGAFRAIFWGLVLLSVVTTIFGILAVKLIHPVNLEVAANGEYEGCDRCSRAYESVFAASLTITQQIIAGDSWGAVTIPVIEENSGTFIFFISVLAIVGMVFLNLILAVVIDSANQARNETDHQRAEAKEAAFREATQHLVSICQSLDADRSGSLTLDELIAGYRNHKEFEDAMILLDIKQKDMSTVFSIMDEDHSGQVRYDEFVEELYNMKSEDSHTMITFIKFYVQEIQREMKAELKATRQLLHEFHESVKEAMSTMHQKHGSSTGAPAATPGASPAATPTSSPNPKPIIPVDLQMPNSGGDDFQRLASAQLDWLKQSQLQVQSMLREVARDVQKSEHILSSMDHSPLLQPPYASSMKHLSISSSSVMPDEQLPGEKHLQELALGKVTNTLLVKPTLSLRPSAAEPAIASSAVRHPPSLMDSHFRLQCCDASSSIAHPPVSIIDA